MKKTILNKGCVSVCNPNNPCAGKYGDCLDVILTNRCNAKCSFCVQRNNKHYVPKADTCTANLADIINKHKAKNILLVGGEPTMSHHLGPLLDKICDNKKVYMTTNGSHLTIPFAARNELCRLSGMNISIHSPDERRNNIVFGIKDEIRFTDIRSTVKWLKQMNPSMNIRINANLFSIGISSFEDFQDMLHLARYLGMDSVRFAELQGVSKEDGFVFAADILPDYFNFDEPFTGGCEKKYNIFGMDFVIRRVCGIVSKNLDPVINPIGRNAKTQVLHPDGAITEGFTGLPDCHKSKKDNQDSSGNNCHYVTNNRGDGSCH